MKTRHIVCEWVGEKAWEAPIVTVSGGRAPATPKLLSEDWSARAGLATFNLASKGCPARGHARLTAALARGAWRLRLSAAILTLALVGSASGQLFDNLQQFS